MSQNRRVVVTGMGAVTPIGLDVDTYWKNLVNGVSGIDFITRFSREGHKVHFSAEIKDWDGAKHFEKKELNKIELFIQFVRVAAKEAWQDAGFKEGDFDPFRFGVNVGSGVGGIEVVEQQTLVMHDRGPRRVTPFLVPRMICNEASGYISIDYGLKGPNLCVVTACATGTHSIGESMEIIKRGDADAMVTGGTESNISALSMAGFANMGALTSEEEDPAKASCPFDMKRTGFVMGEGAGILVLEELEHAKRRGAKIHGEVIGYGLTGDAHHITAPGPGGEGGARAMKMAIDKAGIRPEDVGYVNAHGTSTPLNDKLETMAIKAAFGDHAYKLAVSSCKSMIGHLIGAAGAVEAIASLLAIRDNVLPPTINLTDPDPECDLDYVPNEARKAELRCALSSSLGFGGHNSAVVVREYDE